MSGCETKMRYIWHVLIIAIVAVPATAWWDSEDETESRLFNWPKQFRTKFSPGNEWNSEKRAMPYEFQEKEERVPWMPKMKAYPYEADNMPRKQESWSLMEDENDDIDSYIRHLQGRRPKSDRKQRSHTKSRSRHQQSNPQTAAPSIHFVTFYQNESPDNHEENRVLMYESKNWGNQGFNDKPDIGYLKKLMKRNSLRNPGIDEPIPATSSEEMEGAPAFQVNQYAPIVHEESEGLKLRRAADVSRGHPEANNYEQAEHDFSKPAKTPSELEKIYTPTIPNQDTEQVTTPVPGGAMSSKLGPEQHQFLPHATVEEPETKINRGAVEFKDMPPKLVSGAQVTTDNQKGESKDTTKGKAPDDHTPMNHRTGPRVISSNPAPSNLTGEDQAKSDAKEHKELQERESTAKIPSDAHEAQNTINGEELRKAAEKRNELGPMQIANGHPPGPANA